MLDSDILQGQRLCGPATAQDLVMCGANCPATFGQSTSACIFRDLFACARSAISDRLSLRPWEPVAGNQGSVVRNVCVRASRTVQLVNVMSPRAGISEMSSIRHPEPDENGGRRARLTSRLSALCTAGRWRLSICEKYWTTQRRSAGLLLHVQ
jgi:hypothetical protein